MPEAIQGAVCSPGPWGQHTGRCGGNVHKRSASGRQERGSGSLHQWRPQPWQRLTHFPSRLPWLLLLLRAFQFSSPLPSYYCAVDKKSPFCSLELGSLLYSLNVSGKRMLALRSVCFPARNQELGADNNVRENSSSPFTANDSSCWPVDEQAGCG